MNMTAGSTVPAIITAMIATVISPFTHTSPGRRSASCCSRPGLNAPDVAPFVV